MDYSYSGMEFSGLFAGVFAIAAIIIIFALAIGIFYIIGVWKILKKANQPGWASLIPVYREYLLCKMSGVNPWWVLIGVCAPILNVIPIIGSILSFILTIYFMILLSVSIARSFGKDDSYAIGLVLLAPFFYFALGISDATYKGETPMDDVILSKVMNNSSNNNSSTNNSSSTTINNNGSSNDFNSSNSNNNEQNIAYCPSCGSKISSGTKFCPNCGNEIK